MTLRALIVADHESEYIWDYFDKKVFAGVEVIISCGDLAPAYLTFLVTMLNVPLLYVRGNHDDRYELNPPEGCIDLEARPVTIKGVRFLGLGGCKSTRRHKNHYSESAMSMQLKRALLQNRGKPCDVFVTHAPAAGVGDGEDQFHNGFMCFRNYLERFQPRYHLHGHQHLTYQRDASRVITFGNTIVINAYNYYVVDLNFDGEGESPDEHVFRSERRLPQRP